MLKNADLGFLFCYLTSLHFSTAFLAQAAMLKSSRLSDSEWTIGRVSLTREASRAYTNYVDQERKVRYKISKCWHAVSSKILRE